MCDFKPCQSKGILKIPKLGKSDKARDKFLCYTCFYAIAKLSDKFHKQISSENRSHEEERIFKNKIIGRV